MVEFPGLSLEPRHLPLGALALEGFPGILELSIIFSASERLLLGASKLN